MVYHCVSRAVQGVIFDDTEKSRLRLLMRSQELFAGCRVLAYCFMPDHFHLLVEISPAPAEQITDAELVARLEDCRDDREFAESIAKELAEARATGDEVLVKAIHDRFAYRMNDLGQFMKTFVQRCTHFINSSRGRKGALWQARFKSVIIEEGLATRTLAAYINLNPVRANLAEDPKDYAWSSYGEAVSGKSRQSKQIARQGLTVAWFGETVGDWDPARWKETVRAFRTLLGTSPHTPPEGQDYAMMLRKRIRHFSDGVAIGSRSFVNSVFEARRDDFSDTRKDGARPLSGNARPARDVLWSLRALRTDISS